jgi:hypothetical protein
MYIFPLNRPTLNMFTDLNIFVLFEESQTDPLFDFGQFLSEYVRRDNQHVINVFFSLIFLLNNNFILPLLYSKHILVKKKNNKKDPYFPTVF